MSEDSHSETVTVSVIFITNCKENIESRSHVLIVYYHERNYTLYSRSDLAK